MTLIAEHIFFERSQPLLTDVHCEVLRGECLQIRGANGSGKTTLCRILAGLIEPHSGHVLWQGKSIIHEREYYQQSMHYIGHQNGVRHGLTVEENMILHDSLRNRRIDKTYMQEILEKLHLTRLKHTMASHLSAGQLRRLSLARLLLSAAIVWILDEPFTALDADSEAFFIELLNQHLLSGGMVVISTHQNLTLNANQLKTIQLGQDYV